MTPEAVLHHRVDQAARRIRLLLVSLWTVRMMLAAAVACLVWLVASKARWVETPDWPVMIGVVLAAGLAGAAAGWLPPISRADAARITDQRTGMKERLGSALELERSAPDHPMARRQIRDAGEHAGAVDVRRVYPLRIRRELAGLAATAAVLFGACYLPSLPIFWPRERRQEMEQVKLQGTTMEKIARESEQKSEKERLAETRKAAREARKLAEAMKRGALDKKQSLIAMQKLTKKVEEQHRRLAAASAPRNLSQAADEVKRALEQQQKAITEAPADRKSEAKEVQQAGKQPGGQIEKKAGERPDDPKQAPEQKAGAPNRTEQRPAEHRAIRPPDADPAGKKAAEQKATDPRAAKKIAGASEAMKKAQQAMEKFAEGLEKQSGNQQNQALQELAKQMESGKMTPQELNQLQQTLQKMSQALSKTDLDKASKQLAEIAKQMEELKKMDPNAMKKLAQMMRQAGGT